MKYCTKCGSEIADEAVVCPKCGCAVDNVKTARSGMSVLQIITIILRVVSVVASLSYMGTFFGFGIYGVAFAIAGETGLRLWS